MRGKGADEQGVGGVAGITPAYAGKSIRSFLPRKCCRDHPRVCGEKDNGRVLGADALGSPPRMRGKGNACHVISFLSGITPAYAGKRRPDNGQKNRSGDHPRVCGEKRPASVSFRSFSGSPPRMRGKDIAERWGKDEKRITPAYAGKSTAVR